MAAYEIFKWLKSENCSNAESKRLASKTREALDMTHKQYRKTLSWGRNKVKVLERLMSDGRFEEIEFDKIPSRAGLIYKNAFARRDIIAKRYEAFAKDEKTKVNASVLYPYEIVHKAVGDRSAWYYSSYGWGHRHAPDLSDTDRAMIEKYWNNLPDYLNGADCQMLCVVDTSASMTGSEASAPINVAIGLGMYCAERVSGPFKNNYISFSRRPQLIKIEGIDFVDKARRIYKTNLCEDTNLLATFELIRKTVLNSTRESCPKSVVVISDMEINSGTGHYRSDGYEGILTEMEQERCKWEACGLEFPHLTYWNVDARQNNILDLGPNVSYVSGMSPVIFEQVVKGVSGYNLMLDKLNSKRYEAVQ